MPADEAAFLRKQEQDAKEAISRVLGVMTTDLKAGADPRAWTREYPWLSLGAATVAGFVAACAMVPTKEQSALKKLAEIERALHPVVDHAVNGDQNGHGHGAASRGFFGLGGGGAGGGSSLMSTLFRYLFTMLQPILMSAISGGVAAKAAKETAQSGPTGFPSAGGDSGGAYPPS